MSQRGSDGTWAAPHATTPVSARVVVPGSKSGTARALVLAALASGPGTIRGGLEARDSQLMRGALRTLGVVIDDTDPDVWSVTPPESFVAGGEVDCGLAGTVARFVPPIAALASGTTEFRGDPAASARPVAPLLDGLIQCGATVSGDRLPFAVTGPVRGGAAAIDASASSQFLSGLLLTGARFEEGLRLRHVGLEPVPSLPYVDLTVSNLRDRGVVVDKPGADEWLVQPGQIAPADETVQPDLMNAAAFLAAALVTGGSVTVAGWPAERGLPGTDVPDVFAAFGATATVTSEGLTVTHAGGGWPGVDLDLHSTSEVTPVVAVLAALADSPSRITGVAHIRGHETDRLAALATELTCLGAQVTELPDGLEITPRPLHGGLWHCYADHRLAHAGALIGLAVAEVELDDIGCTSKTMPRFADVWAGMLS